MGARDAACDRRRNVTERSDGVTARPMQQRSRAWLQLPDRVTTIGGGESWEEHKWMRKVTSACFQNSRHRCRPTPPFYPHLPRCCSPSHGLARSRPPPTPLHLALYRKEPTCKSKRTFGSSTSSSASTLSQRTWHVRASTTTRRREGYRRRRVSAARSACRRVRRGRSSLRVISQPRMAGASHCAGQGGGGRGVGRVVRRRGRRAVVPSDVAATFEATVSV